MKTKTKIFLLMSIFSLIFTINLLAMTGTAKSCKEWSFCAQFDEGCMATRWSEISCKITCSEGDPISCPSGGN